MSLKRKRNELIRSAASLALCSAMFIGGTLAYFTKTVSSEGNIITTSKLDIAVLDSTRKPIENGLLSNEAFSPLNPISEKIIVQNIGELPFNYTIGLVPENNEGITVSKDLQDIIMVSIDDEELGTLYNVLNGNYEKSQFNLSANTEAEHIIRLEIPYKDGGYDANIYNGLTVGNFTLQVVANEQISNNR